MTLSSRDALINALANGADRIVIDKSSMANAVAGQLFSLWRATGRPAQGAIPTSASVPTSATTGAIGFTNQTDPVTSYLGWLAAASSLSAMSLEIHDRIAHQGGLVLNVTTSQTTNLPISLATLAPSANRLGAANYSDGQWFLEVYTDGGATASNATIAVTYSDESTGNLNVVAVGGTLRAGRLIALTPFIPIAKQGLFIRSIDSVVLSASTTVAGNFGFTYYRQRTTLPLPLANKTEVGDWALLGCPGVPNDSCLTLIMGTSTTSTGTLRGHGKIIHA